MHSVNISKFNTSFSKTNLNFEMGILSSALDALMNNFYIKCFILWSTLNYSITQWCTCCLEKNIQTFKDLLKFYLPS